MGVPQSENTWIGLLACFLHNRGCRMGSIVTWILWLGSIDDEDWVIYSVIDEALN